MKKLLVAFGFLIIIATGLVVDDAMAYEYVSDHSCHEPYKPYQFNTQHEVDTYNYELDEFRECIEDFVEEQNEAILEHKRVAEDAISDWNNFVRWNS